VTANDLERLNSPLVRITNGMLTSNFWSL